MVSARRLPHCMCDEAMAGSLRVFLGERPMRLRPSRQSCRLLERPTKSLSIPPCLSSAMRGGSNTTIRCGNLFARPYPRLGRTAACRVARRTRT